jgi:nucleotide-binding universal stress UspA family protein
VALETAVALLRKERAEFDLLCVAPEFTPPKASREKDVKKRARMIESYRERIRVEAGEMLRKTQALLATRGIKVGLQTEIGSPARVIVERAVDYDLTVVGAHDRYTRGKPGLGPVASRIVAAAPNAVLIGRESPGDKAWRILAAIDGSIAAEHALNLMGATFNAQAAEITLMHVTESPWIHLGLGREWFESPNEIEATFEKELQYEAEDVVAAARLLLERYGLSATAMITEGDPALEIISEAESGQYDLIVMGASGASDLKHKMLGSVSTRVAQDAPSSVFIAKYTG